MCFYYFIGKLRKAVALWGDVGRRFVSGWMWLYLQFSYSDMGEIQERKQCSLNFSKPTKFQHKTREVKVGPSQVRDWTSYHPALLTE